VAVIRKAAGATYVLPAAGPVIVTVGGGGKTPVKVIEALEFLRAKLPDRHLELGRLSRETGRSDSRGDTAPVA